jgi:HEAT repeat protein
MASPNIAELFSSRARDCGLSIPAAAKAAGVTYEVALRAFQGRTVPREDTARALADVLLIDEPTWRESLAQSLRAKRATPSDPRSAYLTALAREHEYLYPSGIAQTVKAVPVRLEEVYVSLQAQADDPRFAAKDLGRPADGECLVEPVTDESCVEAATTSTRTTSAEIVDLPILVDRSVFAVLTGAPGAGKTTLLKHLALLFARSELKGEEKTRDSAGTVYGRSALPVLCRIAHFAEQNTTDDLRDFLAHNLQPLRPETSRRLFDDAFRSGRILILLDGLDEIATDSGRPRVNKAIERLREQCGEAGNRLIVTSRVRGYDEAPLVGFKVFSVRNMDRDQVARFLRSWCTAMEREIGAPRPEESGEREAASILQAVEANAGVRDLAVNPLLCTLIALIHRNHYRLPERRSDLLKVAVDTLLRLWRARQLNAGDEELPQISISSEEEALIIRPLARWIHENFDSGVVDEPALIQRLSELLAQARGHSASPAEGAEVAKFLDRVRRHSGILVERSRGRYSFMHLLFQEYLTGLALVDSTVDAVEEIRARRHDPRWEEPIRLGIASKSTGDASYLIRAGVLGQRREPGGKWVQEQHSTLESVLHRDLLFAVRCAGDCAALDPSLGDELADRLISVILCPATRNIGPLQGKVNACLPAITFHQCAGPKIIKQLIATVLDRSSALRRAAAEALGNLTEDEAVRQTLASLLRNRDSYLRWTAASALGKGAAHDEVQDALKGALSDPDRYVRVIAAEALSRTPYRSGILEILTSATKEDPSYIRFMAVIALARLAEDPTARQALFGLLGDRDIHVRAMVGAALSSMLGSTELTAALEEALENDDPLISVSTAGILIRVGEKKALTVLLRALADADPEVRATAAEALGGASRDQNVRRNLLRALTDQIGRVRASAAEALGGVAEQADVRTALLHSLCDREPAVRAAAANALTKASGDVNVQAALLQKLRDRSALVRQSSVEALMVVTSEPGVRHALLRTAKDRSGLVRAAAVGALGSLIADPEVRDVLLTALNDKEWQVRNYAAAALRSQANHADVRDALLATMNDKEGFVAGTAWQALLQGTAPLGAPLMQTYDLSA